MQMIGTEMTIAFQLFPSRSFWTWVTFFLFKQLDYLKDVLIYCQ